MRLGKLIQKNNDFMPSDVSIQEVIDSMISNKTKHTVLLKDNKALGILTERDILFLYTNHIDFNKKALDFATKELIIAKENRKIDYALNLMVDNNIRRVIIVNKEKKYIGSINQEDIIFEFEQDVYKSHIKIKDLIKPSNKAMHINENDTLQNAIDLMSKNNIGSVLIYNKNSTPIGIITESDVVSFAHKKIDTNEKVSLYMHFPVITFDENELLHQIVSIMKEKNIRRVLVNNQEEKQFYVITSKDILNNLKGNYSIYLESKLRDVKKTFNLLDETVIELFDYENEQIIHWYNKKAKKLFDINIDDEITKFIPKKTWKDIYKKIKTNTYKDNEIIKINSKSYKLIAIHTIVLDNSIIKLLFDDVTQLLEKQSFDLDIYKKSLELLPTPIAIVDDSHNIIFKNRLFKLDSSEIKKTIEKNETSSMIYRNLTDQLYLINLINS